MTKLAQNKSDHNGQKVIYDHMIKSDHNGQKVIYDHMIKSDQTYVSYSSKILLICLDNFSKQIEHAVEKSNSYDSQRRFNFKPCDCHMSLDFQDSKNSSKNIIVESQESVINRMEFKKFSEKNVDNPKYKNKYVAFVKGECQDVGDDQIALVLKMREKFGDVSIYVSEITKEQRILKIR